MIRILAIAALLIPLSVAAEAQSRGPTPVFVTEVTEASFADRIEALGTLRANESIVVTSNVSELINSINFNDGERVEQGDVLVELISAEPEAQLEEQQSTLNEAKRQIERLRPLVRQGAASQSLLDEREREAQTAQARVNALESRLKNYKITAPFAGVVGLRNISTGALLQPGTQITTLDDDSVMKLDFAVPSVYLPSLQLGLPITATARAYQGQNFEGTIASIDSQIDPVTRSVMVRALLPNEDRILKPGLLMSVVLFKDQRDAILVPEESLLAENDDMFVFVLQDEEEGDSSVEKRAVKIGSRQPGVVEILSGLTPGEQIVTHGTLKLQDGAKVKVSAVETGTETLKEMLDQNTNTSAAETVQGDDQP